MHFNLTPIGFVKNSIEKRSDMTAYGVRSVIEILPEYIQAIDSIEENSHLIVSCFFHHAKRDVLRVHPRKFNIYSIAERGVFATRSPDRPNPISFSVVKLLRITDKTKLEVEGLDLINGTPVIDIKPYTEMDIVFNMRRFSKKTSFAQTKEEVLHDYLLKNISAYIFEEDGTLGIALCSLVKLIKAIEKIPDREILEKIETNFTGNALDCIYYYSRFTPGEGKIHSASSRSSNTYIRLFLKSSQIWEAKIRNSEWVVMARENRKD